MDLYFLNFKRAIVVLSNKEMRQQLFDIMDANEIDINLKFVDSYFQAAKLIQENKHDPYDHIILNLSYSSRKLNDFVEFLEPMLKENPDFLLEFSPEHGINLVDVE